VIAIVVALAKSNDLRGSEEFRRAIFSRAGTRLVPRDRGERRHRRRLGEHRDAPKAQCGTCHNGNDAPTYGAKMVKDYSAL